jgi:hypothetical protein
LGAGLGMKFGDRIKSLVLSQLTGEQFLVAR